MCGRRVPQRHHRLVDLVEHPAGDHEIVLGQGAQVDFNAVHGEGEHQPRGRKPGIPLAQKLRLSSERGHQASAVVHRVPDAQVQVGGFQVQPGAERANIARHPAGPPLDAPECLFPHPVKTVILRPHRLIELKCTAVFGISEIAALSPAFRQQRGQVQAGARWIRHGRTPYSGRDSYVRENSDGATA